jgi:hypothetical protein
MVELAKPPLPLMPELSPKTKQYHKQRVRSLMVQQPTITILGMQKWLEHDGLHLDRGYIASLCRGIQTERIKRSETWTLNAALASLQDSMLEIVRVAWEIVNDPMAKNQDRVMAMREIRESHNLVFEKLFDAGVFERKLGTLDATIRNTPLPEERKQAIRATFQNWGLLAPEPLQITSDSLQTKEDEPSTITPA